ncbi:hypothetical protein DL769_005260 [Monosporascus sp. CRB-8-3]|nr:hypothetical protein DL769_005260 [Monosporascus sp. CRB-8-3]
MLTRPLIATAIFATTAVTYPSNIYGGSGPDVLCVYPLSGLYTPLQRILFYLLLIYGVLGRRQRWLVAGALASAMSYGGAASIHSILLVSRSRSPYAIDLDVYGVFAITSTGVLLTGPLLTLSTTLHRIEKEIRTIVILWAHLMLLGAILAVSSIYAKEDFVTAPACLPPEEAMTSATSLFQSPTENCTYACFQKDHTPFRSLPNIMAWPNRTDPAKDITGVFVPCVASALPTALICGIMDHIRMRRGDRRRVSDYFASPPALHKYELSWIMDRLLGRRHNHVSSATMSSPSLQNRTSRHIKFWTAFQYYYVICSFGTFALNIILNEIRFQHLPTIEKPYEVGQWAPWVSVMLVVSAQITTHYLGRRSRRQKKRDEEEICGPESASSPTGRQRKQGEMQETGFKMSSWHSAVLGFKRRNSV